MYTYDSKLRHKTRKNEYINGLTWDLHKYYFVTFALDWMNLIVVMGFDSIEYFMLFYKKKIKKVKDINIKAKYQLGT